MCFFVNSYLKKIVTHWKNSSDGVDTVAFSETVALIVSSPVSWKINGELWKRFRNAIYIARSIYVCHAILLWCNFPCSMGCCSFPMAIFLRRTFWWTKADKLLSGCSTKCIWCSLRLSRNRHLKSERETFDDFHVSIPKWLREFKPLNNGDILNIVMHPLLENCPMLVSIKYNGIPQTNNIMRYGTRNAPEIHFLFSNKKFNNENGKFIVPNLLRFDNINKENAIRFLNLSNIQDTTICIPFSISTYPFHFLVPVKNNTQKTLKIFKIPNPSLHLLRKGWGYSWTYPGDETFPSNRLSCLTIESLKELYLNASKLR